jgi:hypothetical protein
MMDDNFAEAIAHQLKKIARAIDETNIQLSDMNKHLARIAEEVMVINERNYQGE